MRILAALACNLYALNAMERSRYQESRGRLLAAVRERRELANGFAFRLDGEAVSRAVAKEWMDLERRCCPFLTLELAGSGQEADVWLRLTGGPGVKEFLAGEFVVSGGGGGDSVHKAEDASHQGALTGAGKDGADEVQRIGEGEA